eukprot:jgi/Botrbrau1/15/Bobra.0022s0012.1
MAILNISFAMSACRLPLTRSSKMLSSPPESGSQQEDDETAGYFRKLQRAKNRARIWPGSALELARSQSGGSWACFRWSCALRCNPEEVRDQKGLSSGIWCCGPCYSCYPSSQNPQFRGFSAFFGINIGTVAIPAAVLGLGAAAVLGLKLDKDLPKFFDETIVKDSGSYAGYENVLKSDNGKVAGSAKPTKPTGKPKVAKALPKATSGFITLNIGKK